MQRRGTSWRITRYYGSFLVEQADAALRHYNGVVQVASDERGEVPVEAVAEAVGEWLARPAASVRVLHWSRLH